MRLLLSRRRQRKVSRFFARHGAKAVFFARFFAGVRIGVYAYAGSQRMRWSRFLLLDLMGALISGPTSVFLGALVARKIVTDRDEAVRVARHVVTQFGHWILLAVAAALAAMLLVRLFRRSVPGALPSHGSEVKAELAAEGPSGSLDADEELVEERPLVSRALEETAPRE